MEEFIRKSSFLRRLLTEEACIGMLERQIGAAGKQITHEQAILRWNSGGYHSRFSLAYSDGKAANEVFTLVTC